MPDVQTQTRDAAGPIFSFILGGIPPVTDCHLAQVKRLLEGGADVEETAWQGESALLYAVHRNNLALVTLLLDYGASIDRRTNYCSADGVAPFSEACAHGHALSHACGDGRYELARLLLDRGASVDLTGPNGATPLSYACEHLLRAPWADAILSPEPVLGLSISDHVYVAFRGPGFSRRRRFRGNDTVSALFKYVQAEARVVGAFHLLCGFPPRDLAPLRASALRNADVHGQAIQIKVADSAKYLDVFRLLLGRGADLDLGKNPRDPAPSEIHMRMGHLTLLSALEKARDYGIPALKSLVRAHLARSLRATARGSQVWAPRVASFLI